MLTTTHKALAVVYKAMGKHHSNLVQKSENLVLFAVFKAPVDLSLSILLDFVTIVAGMWEACFESGLWEEAFVNSDAVSKSCLCSIKEQSKIFLHLSSSLCLPASSAGMKVTVASYFQDLHSSVFCLH